MKENIKYKITLKNKSNNHEESWEIDKTTKDKDLIDVLNKLLKRF